jgi:hypothetical protein
MAVCHQLITMLEAFEHRLTELSKIDILILCGLFLTTSRDYAGICPPHPSS